MTIQTLHPGNPIERLAIALSRLERRVSKLESLESEDLGGTEERLFYEQLLDIYGLTEWRYQMKTVSPIDFSVVPHTASLDMIVTTVPANHYYIITDLVIANIGTTAYKGSIYFLTDGSHVSSPSMAWVKSKSVALGSNWPVAIRRVLEVGDEIIVQSSFANGLAFGFSGVDILLS
jgi:hypothetical protein